MKPPATAARRRWFQFSLRTLFVAVTLAAILSPFVPATVQRIRAWWFPPSMQIQMVLPGLNRFSPTEEEEIFGSVQPATQP
jgi:hypothetical protein